MELRKAETILEKASTKTFVFTLFSRMLQQQSPTDINQQINEAIEVADIGHTSLSPAVAVDRAVRILTVTHWARTTFSSDVSTSYKLLLQHTKALPAPSGQQKGNVSPGLDGALFNFVIEKLVESFFLNSSVSHFIVQRISRRPTDAVSFPSYHSAALACQIARDITNVSVKLYSAIQDRRMNPKLLTEQLRAAARALASANIIQLTIPGSGNSGQNANKSQDPSSGITSSSVLSECLAAFRPSKLVPGKSELSANEKPLSKSMSTGTLQQRSNQEKQNLDGNKPNNVNEFTISILDIFFILY